MRQICNLSVQDLERWVDWVVLNSNEILVQKCRIAKEYDACLVVNKFDLSVDPLAVRCWAEHLRNSRTP